MGISNPCFVKLTALVRAERRTYPRWCNLATVTDMSESEGSTKIEFVTGRFERVAESPAQVLALATKQNGALNE